MSAQAESEVAAAVVATAVAAAAAEVTERVVLLPAVLDASVAVEAPGAPIDDELVGICQICMDVVPARQVVTGVCGAQCLAEICRPCLVRHLTASVYSFYPGVLPKVRCPICLTLLNKNQWENFVKPMPTPVPASMPSTDEAANDQSQSQNQNDAEEEDDNTHVLAKYKVLCQQSCGFQSPCCHNAEYTMLPPVAPRKPDNADTSSDEDSSDGSSSGLVLSPAQLDALPELQARCLGFCYHQEEPGDLYAFLLQTFDTKVEEALWAILPKMADEERRAALLLRHLFEHPDTRTRCCNMRVCFKCKAANHHAGACHDFVEDENVLECRGCHVTLVMVDGCDSLRCLCGHSFSWSSEMARQRRQRKLLAPTADAEYDRWMRWHVALQASFVKVADVTATQRELRLAKLLRDHRALLRRVLLPRLYRQRMEKHDVGGSGNSVNKPKTLELETDMEPQQEAVGLTVAP